MKVIILQAFFLVLNHTEYLEPLLEKFLENGISGVTVFQSTGMMRVLDKSGDDSPMFGALRELFDPSRKNSSTLMMVLEDSQAATVRKLICEVTGGLDKPDSGILFAVPVLYTEGIGAC